MEPRPVRGLGNAAGRLVSSLEPAALIVTVRNEASTVGPLIDSILAGTRVPEEIVVADGGSTDGTFDLLRARASTDPRIRAAQPRDRLLDVLPEADL